MNAAVNTQPPALAKGMPSDPITVSELKDALPSHLKSCATQGLADRINTVTNDPIASQSVKQNFVGFVSVLSQGKFKTEDYLNAVSYVSFKLMGFTNQDAYRLTFPDRYNTLLQEGKTAKQISSYVAGFHKNKLVTLIMQQSLVPIWVTNQDVLQEAINHQAYLMVNAKSEKVQSDAANSIMTHLKQPEAKDINLRVGVTESEGTRELKNLMENFAAQQIKMLEDGGMTTKQVAEQRIIEADYEEVDDK